MADFPDPLDCARITQRLASNDKRRRSLETLMSIKGKGTPFSKYKRGLSSTPDIRKAIRQAWEEIIKDPKDRAKAELLLDLPPGSLSETSPLPYGVAVEGAGLTGVEAIILLVLWDFAKDLGYDIL